MSLQRCFVEGSVTFEYIKKKKHQDVSNVRKNHFLWDGVNITVKKIQRIPEYLGGSNRGKLNTNYYSCQKVASELIACLFFSLLYMHLSYKSGVLGHSGVCDYYMQEVHILLYC